MTEWASYTQGQRIKILRGRELTQDGLAEKAGISVKTVQKAEQNGTLSLPTYLVLAAALDTDLAVLLGQRDPERGATIQQRGMLRAISQAIHDTASGYIPEHAPTASNHDLAAVVESAWNAYWASDYTDLGGLLPGLLYSARAAAHNAPADQTEAPLAALSDGYQVAAYLANQVGHRDLAYSAAQQASAAAALAGDPIRAARIEGCRSWIYRKDGRVTDSLRLAERAARSIEPSFSEADTGVLTAYGNLMLHCAIATSRLHKDNEEAGWDKRAGTYLSQANAAGAMLGAEYHCHGGHFGPANAEAKSVDVNLSIGKVGKALGLIKTFRGEDRLAPAVKNRFLLDKAWAQTEAKQYDTALDTLLDACGDAPGWARNQTLPALLVSRMPGTVSQSRLRKLSRILGTSMA
jgi:transcriptional regulator with XRE-family HTH domain